MAQQNPNIQFLIVKGSQLSYSLDVEKITDFPLALTYSIKDVQDPNSSKGSFSKTFSIPATKNNNTILSDLFSDSLYDSYQYIEDWDAQIFVDGLLILQGKFQIKGSSYQGIAQSYDCNVYGENFKWVNALSELNLCDIDFDAGNFFPDAPTNATIGKTAIENTWQFGLAGETIGGVQTHMVYPLVNAGKWNYMDDGNAFVSPSDMSPAFYFYNMLKVIFAKQGYTIESSFFETDWFKRLVSYMPKEDFLNSNSVIEQYSFSYENNTPTDFKTPLNYQNTGGTPNDCSGVVGNTWHGQMTDLTLVCPSCDPSNLITQQSFSFQFDIQTPMNFLGLASDAKPTIAGWFWGSYGINNNSGNRTTWLAANPCSNGNEYVGLDFSCVACDIFNGTNTQQVFPSTSKFETSYLGTYEFNGSMQLEMDNSYELTNPVYAYDGSTNNATRGTGNGGVGIDCQDIEQGSVNDYNITYRGTTYVFNVYLVHYKATTGRHHIVAVNSERKLNNSSPYWTKYFCNDYPLGATNLVSTLGFSGVQIDILNANDKVYMYSEVTCEVRNAVTNNFFSESPAIGLTQMKYKCNEQKFSGNITPTLIEGGSIDLASLLPCDTSQLDWVNGLTGMFNLMWASDEVSKTIRVEPRDMFFDTVSNAIDWTKKLDHSQAQTNVYIYDALKRNLCFTYENDSNDKFVEERNRRRGQNCELGSHSLNLGELFTNEEQKIGSDFYSPSYMFYDNTISDNANAYKQPFVPVIHSEYSTIWNASSNAALPEKTTDYNPRILTWFGLQPLNQADGIDAANTWRWGYDNNSDAVESLTTYPFAGVYCDQDGTLGGSLVINSITYNNPSLYFENSDINSVSTAPPYAQTSGLYKMFWEFNILTLIKRPIIKKAFFKLTPKDIANLDFKKLIHLKSSQSDTYWILNKITDYKAGANQLTSVELFEYHNTRPLESDFPYLSEGNGKNDTPQWSDFDFELVNNGVIKLPPNLMQNNLGIYDTTKIPILSKGTQSSSLPTKQPDNILPTGQKTATSYFDAGTRAPIGGNLGNSGNIGNNNNINVGAISIGNNIINQKSNQIVIGDGNNTKSLSAIEMTTNGRTAFAIKSDGIFREGGGGVIYYEDATTGEVREVITGVPQTAQNLYGKPIKLFYTRVTHNDEGII